MPKKKAKRTYGSGTYFRRAGRTTWTISWRENGVRRFEHGISTEKLAKDGLARIMGEIANGRVGLKKDPKDAPTLNAHALKWLANRKATHRSAYDDANRWENHFEPKLGKLKPNAVTVAVLKDFIREKSKALSSTTVNLLIRLLSSLYTDLVEDGHAEMNPTRLLSKTTRRKFLRPAHDPKTTPYIEAMGDVVRLYQWLAAKSPSVGMAYALGALGGLRTGEVRALSWKHIDLTAKSIHVQVQVERRQGKDPAEWSKDGTQVLKDDESRIVPIQASLTALLKTWKEQTGGKGLVCPPVRKSGQHLDDAVMSRYLRDALEKLKLEKEGLGWYQATRHTFASQFVLAGGSLETLRRIMGHSTVLVTERYAHLQPDHFAEADLRRMTADFSAVAPAASAAIASETAASPDRKLDANWMSASKIGGENDSVTTHN
jgi:integrase